MNNAEMKCPKQLNPINLMTHLKSNSYGLEKHVRTTRIAIWIECRENTGIKREVNTKNFF